MEVLEVVYTQKALRLTSMFVQYDCGNFAAIATGAVSYHVRELVPYPVVLGTLALMMVSATSK